MALAFLAVRDMLEEVYGAAWRDSPHSENVEYGSSNTSTGTDGPGFQVEVISQQVWTGGSS